LLTFVLFFFLYFIAGLGVNV